MPKTLFLLLITVLSKQALNFNYFEKEDKDQDGKLSLKQFVEGLRGALQKSGIEKSAEMVQDFTRYYAKFAKLRENIDLHYIRQKVDSNDLLNAFFDWREKMWKERIALEGKHDPRDGKVLKNPEIYGYKYRNLDQVRAERRNDL